jgi:hypothetical protein
MSKQLLVISLQSKTIKGLLKEIYDIKQSIKNGDITDVVFRGWEPEYCSLFPMIKNGETKVTRLYFDFYLDYGILHSFTLGVMDVFMSPQSTVKYFDFSKSRMSVGIEYCYVQMYKALNANKIWKLDRNIYVRTHDSLLKWKLTIEKLKTIQNVRRVELVLLVLASGEMWKRGTQKSAMKKFPRDMIQLTASFI